ncbi:MAG: tetratricopeptide repeat protein [Cyanobacteria bacterium REEB67]|nr:tetratricopeptide repeat protein [Cyanobacteria bacterium REEB67]
MEKSYFILTKSPVYLAAFLILCQLLLTPTLAETKKDLLGRVSDCTAWQTEPYMQAGKLREKGDCQSALRLYDAAIAKAGPEAESSLFYQRGETYFQMKNYQRALENYSIALSKHSDDYLANLQMAFCWYKLGDYKKARIDLRDSQRICPTPSAQCLNGLLFAQESKSKEALANLKACLAKDSVSYLTEDQQNEAKKTIALLERK